MKVITAIVEQHAEEAAFLWLLRDRSILAAHLSLSDLIKLDERIEAHADGLRIAEEEGWEIAERALAHKEDGEVFTASLLAFESGIQKRIDSVLEIATASPALARPVISALGWMSPQAAATTITQLGGRGDALCRHIAVAAAAAHRIHPGRVLDAGLATADDPLLTARTLRAAGELGLTNVLPAIRPHLEAENEDVRFAAAWAAVMLNDRDGIPVLGAFAADGGPYAEQACMLGLRRLPVGAALKAHKEMVSRPELARLSVAAAGFIGDPALAEWLLDAMSTPDLARLAGEAFATMTGADLANPPLEGAPPEHERSDATEEADDVEAPAEDPDENLPWPNREKLTDWWFYYRDEFRPGTRYLLGNPIAEDWMWEVLGSGRQRHRAAAALELALASPGPLFEIRAPGFRQLAAVRA